MKTIKLSGGRMMHVPRQVWRVGDHVNVRDNESVRGHVHEVRFERSIEQYVVRLIDDDGNIVETGEGQWIDQDDLERV